MRQVVLDTETTGLDPSQGHRIIEIGALEIVSRRITGRTFHVYLNPEREIDAGAITVHGLTNEFLTDKPRFADIADEFLAFVQGAELVIHNAPFDLGFLNAELSRIDRPPIERVCSGVLDTLKFAKELHPGQKNNLDALCRRYEIDNSGRAYHGALLDAQLLAEVYLAMTRGQESLSIEQVSARRDRRPALAPGVRLRVQRASPEEQQAHFAYLAGLSQETGTSVEW